MEKLSNQKYSANPTAFSNHCIGHWVVADELHSHCDSPIGHQQAKNMRDHVIMEFAMKTNGTVRQVVDKDLTKLIEKAISTDKKYVIVLRDYTIKIGQLIPALADFIATDLKDEVIVGHLLDWKNEYYEIHHQAFMLDLEWYVAAGKPSFDTGFGQGNWVATEVERSKDNFHDADRDHTPIWIKAGHAKARYNGWRMGGLVMAKALEDNKTVSPWPEYVRDAKTYLYPELSNEHYRHYQNYINGAGHHTYFATNTETVHKDSPGGDYDIMFLPASGIFSLVSPYINGINPQADLISYDISPIALRFIQYLDRWPGPGTDLAQYIQRFVDHFSEFHAVTDNEQLDKINEWVESLGKGYKTWWNFTRRYITKDTQLVNLMYFKDYKQLLDGRILNFRAKYPNIEKINIFISLSNIFHYPPNSMVYSLRYRTEVLEEILEYNQKLKEQGVNVDVTVVKPLLDKYSKFEELPFQLQEALSYKDH